MIFFTAETQRAQRILKKFERFLHEGQYNYRGYNIWQIYPDHGK